SKGYSLKTIKSQDCYIRKFTKWLKEKEIALQSIDYQTLLSFVSVERKKGSNPANLKNQIQAIRIYLDYQNDTGIIELNPAEHIKIQDTLKKTLLPAIEEETLLNAYKSFANKDCKITRGKSEHQRDTVALGLMVFQGLDSGDLERLTVKDINLTEGTVYIASSRKNASRTLKLEPSQILSIHEYLTITRNLLNENKINSDKMFIKQKINDMVSAIVQKLKAVYPEIQNPRHIRSSVIMNLLKKYHIRQVQYMAGHRRVSSTEKYKKEDLHDLSWQLGKYHPIK
ncbi:MAG: site-specific integrase, partial [Clostridiales bacterium]|nr:site-specific integrase [Clostridiales bacterium]